MSLSALTYKYIGKFTAPASTTSGTMAALATAFSSATYADGSSRVTGSHPSLNLAEILRGSAFVNVETRIHL